MKKKNALKKLDGKGLAKKVLGIVAISTIGLSAIFGLAGCMNGKNAENTESKKYGILLEKEYLEDSYILVPNEKGEFVLHKGNIYSLSQESGYRASKYGSDKLVLDCGEEVYTGMYKAYSKKPKKDGHYVKECEDCFGHEHE